MPYDPNEWYNNYLDRLRNPFSGMPGMSAAKPEPSFPALPMGEESSLLGKITEGVLGGLGYLGKSLDKLGGRAIRGVLGGNPHELLSLIPFSDTAGITKEEDSVSGRQLLEKMGILSPGTPGIDMGDVAGFGVDVLTDPLSWLTFGATSGAKTALGRIAAKAGVMPKVGRTAITGFAEGAPEIAKLAQAIATPGLVSSSAGQELLNLAAKAKPGWVADLAGGFDKAWASTREALEALHPGLARAETIAESAQRIMPDLVGKQLGGLMGTGFLSNLVPGLGGQVFGSQAANLAALDKIGWATGKLAGLPVIKQGVQIASPVVDTLAGLFSRDTPHKGLQAVLDEVVKPAIEQGTATTLQKHIAEIEAARAGGYAGREAEEVVRRAGEGLPLTHADLPGPPTETMVKAAETGEQFAQKHAQELIEARDIGRDVHKIENYVPGTADMEAQLAKMPAGGRKLLNTWNTNQLERLEFFKGDYRNLGHSEIEQILKDPRATAPALNPALGEFATSSARDRIMDYLTQGKKLTADEQRAAFKQADKLAKWTTRFDTYAPNEFFFRSPIVDSTLATANHIRSQAAAEGVQELFARNLTPLGEEGIVPLNQKTWDSVGLRAFTQQPNGENLSNALNYFAKKTGKSIEELKDFGVPADVLSAAASYMNKTSMPESIKEAVHFWDKLTNWFKAGVTVPFPGFHVRNLVQGGWQNMVGNAYDPTRSGFMKWLAPFLDAQKMASGEGVIEGLLTNPAFQRAGITSNEQATKILSEMAYSHGLYGPRDLSLIGASKTGVSDLTSEASNLSKVLPGEKDFVKAPTFNPLEWIKHPLERGQEMAHYGDTLNRLSAFTAYVKQGFEPEVAAAMTKGLHYDYGALTNFEKGVMRRLVPFYSWSRKNADFVIKTMLTTPGLENAGFRVTNAMRDKGEFTPPFIGEGLAIPLPGSPEGFQRYISGFGLGIEDETIKALGSALHGEGGRAMGSLLSALHPAIKYPLEVATGKQLFTGRNLSDLEPSAVASLGGLLPRQVSMPISELLSNSPAARVQGIIDKIVDTAGPEARKGPIETGINLLTGARITDVDMVKQREIAAQKIIADLLRGRQGLHVYERPYARTEDIPTLDPESVLLLRLQTGLEHKRQERARLLAK